jgi:hypothetical protein
VNVSLEIHNNLRAQVQHYVAFRVVVGAVLQLGPF